MLFCDITYETASSRNTENIYYPVWNQVFSTMFTRDHT
jgi:hypothetical protein